MTDAGGPRPKDDLVERLTKACKVADACPECLLDREQAAAEIERLQAEIARLQKGRDIIEDRLQLLQRAQSAEAERDAAIAARESIEEFSHMKTHEIARMLAVIDAAKSMRAVHYYGELGRAFDVALDALNARSASADES